MNISRAKIRDVKLVQEGEVYYLNLTYDCEDEKSVYVLNIPRVELPYFDNPYINVINDGDATNATIGFFGGVRLPIYKDQNGALLSKVVIEEKTHKMTVAEIEKKLGYKIEIVSNK